MTLTKNDITEKVRDQLDRAPKRLRFSKYHACDPDRQYGLTKNKCKSSIETLIETIKQNLERGDDVLISGFGKFCVNEKNPRKGRDPSTGDDLILRKRRVVTFRCSGKLRKQVNKG